MLRQHRHQAEDQRKLAIVAGELETDRIRSDRLRLDHLAVIDAVVRASLVAQQLPREQDVVGRDRLAVGKSRGRIELERHEAARAVGNDAARNQSVERERLVEAARHQALDDMAADDECATRRPHPQGRKALHDERVEAVEGAEHTLDQPAALGRGWIDVAEMRKPLRQRRLAVHGDRVAGDTFCEAV